MYWWLWLLLGLVLLGGELLTPGGFYVIFFAAGALAVGILSGLGVGGPVWVQWLLFSAISLASLFLLRPYLIRWARSSERPDPMDTLEGELAVPCEEIAPGAVGRVELRGTSWTAHNDDSRALASGQRCRVVRVDGLTLRIRAE